MVLILIIGQHDILTIERDNLTLLPLPTLSGLIDGVPVVSLTCGNTINKNEENSQE